MRAISLPMTAATRMTPCKPTARHFASISGFDDSNTRDAAVISLLLHTERCWGYYFDAILRATADLMYGPKVSGLVAPYITSCARDDKHEAGRWPTRMPRRLRPRGRRDVADFRIASARAAPEAAFEPVISFYCCARRPMRGGVAQKAKLQAESHGQLVRSLLFAPTACRLAVALLGHYITSAASGLRPLCWPFRNYETERANAYREYHTITPGHVDAAALLFRGMAIASVTRRHDHRPFLSVS